MNIIELVCQTEYYDIYIISWKRSQRTKIHDHPIQGCLMKVLNGRLKIYTLSPSRRLDAFLIPIKIKMTQLPILQQIY